MRAFPDLLLSCVAWSKLLRFSEPQFSLLGTEDRPRFAAEEIEAQGYRANER